MRKTIPYSCPICASRLPRAAARCFFCESPLPLHKGKATASAPTPRLPRADPEALRRQELPRLYVAVQDFGRLETLAHIGLSDGGGDLLRSELDRAIVCDSEAVPQGAVRVGSIVVVRDRGEDGTAQKIRGMLVYPGECHPHLPSIAVSSPLGSAILGLSVGDVMPYAGAGGIRHVATVLSVVRPEPRDGDSRNNATDRDGVPA
jgi:transcription elongation GreA/GreB family factor